MVDARQEEGKAPYQPLAPGKRGLSRAQVAADQRRRLQGAMIAAVAARGYPATTVGDVVALARVSRTTFYQQFRSKRDCFLATYDEIVKDSGARVTRAYRAHTAWQDQLEAAFREFIAIVAERPEVGRLVFIDALALGGDIAAHRDDAARTFERLIRQAFDRIPGVGRLAQATVTGLVGGMRRVVYMRLHEGRAEELPALTDDLLRWALCYPLPTSAPVPPPEDPPQSRAPAATDAGPALALPQARLRYTPRERIILAVTSLTSELGYAALTIPAISARAGTSNQTLYEQFSDKQGAFLAAYDFGSVRALTAARSAFDAAPEWPAAIGAAADALLSFLSREPEFARLAFVELPTAGQLVYERLELTLDMFAGLLEPGQRLRPDLPPVVAQAIAGAIWSVIYDAIRRGRTAQLPCLAPCVAYVALAPFIGAEQAARAIAEQAARGPDGQWPTPDASAALSALTP